MAVNIVTGRVGEVHITSDDDRARHASVFSAEARVLPFGTQFAATISGMNVTISSGMLVNQGTQMGIEPYDSETVEIASGILTKIRHDLIIMRYKRNYDDDTESAELAILQGVTVSSNPSDPTWTSGDILDGGESVDEFPLYRVVIDGTGISEVVPLFEVVDETYIDADLIQQIWENSLQDGDGREY